MVGAPTPTTHCRDRISLENEETSGKVAYNYCFPEVVYHSWSESATQNTSHMSCSFFRHKPAEWFQWSGSDLQSLMKNWCSLALVCSLCWNRNCFRARGQKNSCSAALKVHRTTPFGIRRHKGPSLRQLRAHQRAAFSFNVTKLVSEFLDRTSYVTNPMT